MDETTSATPTPPTPTPPTPTSPQPAPSGAATPPQRRRWHWLGGVAATLAILIVAGLGLVAWALHSASGSAWLLALAPQLKVVAPHGSLLGDFSAERVEITLPGSSGALRLDAPRWQALSATRGDHGRWLHLTIDTLHADRVTLLPATRPASTAGAPATPPSTLRLPIELEIRAASVDELRFGAADDATRLTGLHGRVHLGDDAGRAHRFDALEAGYLQAGATGRASIAADAPFTVDAQLALAYDHATPAWHADATAAGPLDALRVKATVRAVAAAASAPSTTVSTNAAPSAAPTSAKPADTTAAPSLDADAVVRPFAAWPLGELHASTSALDLSAFSSSAPATALSGTASMTTSGLDRPASLSVDLRNARAGRWNEGLLPVRRVRADLHARPDAPTVLDVQTLVGDLGSMQAAAGNITARGGWAPEGWTLQATLDKVDPAGLDARAPDTALGGKVDASSEGAGDRTIAITADLAGALVDRRLPHGAPRSATLRFDAHIGEREITLRSAEARSGDARATATAKLSRATPEAAWRAIGRVALAAFDPAPWWPGGADALLARGTNRLDAEGEFDLQLPRGADSSVYAMLAATRGHAKVRLDNSTLAGVPLAGQAGFDNSDGAARPSLDLVAGANSFKASGRIAASGTGDAWMVDIDAPELVRLAPLLRPPGAAASSPAVGGALKAKATIDGRWPGLTSRGELHGTSLAFDGVTVRQADANWSLGSAADAALAGTVQLEDTNVSGRLVEHVRAELAGTARAHRLTLDVASEALPPEWVDAVSSATATATVASAAGASAAASSVAAATPAGQPPLAGRSAITLRAEGGLVDVGSDRSAGWSGVLHELVARSIPTPGSGAPTRTWLRADEVRGKVLWSGGPTRVDVDPGVAQALGGTVRWSRIAWQAGDAGGAARLDAQAVVDPVPVAPLLRALQPDFGWGGDLAVGARLEVHSAPRVVVDVVVQRARGDLTVTDEIGTQALGFSDLRFGVVAKDGVWSFTSAIAGSTLGVASGSVTARTSSASTWPAADTPVQGVLEVQIANLGTWGRWVPAGWRLAGAVHANASIAGRFDRPAYTGHVEGTKLGVRNFLQGVNVTDGDVAIALQGSTARIEHFTAKGGDGSIRLEGDASFDAAPVAQLKMTADKFLLLGRLDRRIVASGDATMRLDAQSIALGGGFKIDEGLIDFTRSDAPTLGDDVAVTRRPLAANGVAAGAAPVVVVAAPRTTSTSASALVATSAPAAAAAALSPAVAASAAAAVAAVPGPVSRKVALDLRVGMGEKLRIRGRGLDAGLKGELHITSPAGKLAVDGTLSAVDGTYQAYGQKLGIDRGVITFAGPIENPRLDIEATRPDLDVRVGVIVVGTALNPRIRLFSEPDMTDIDKLSWLILGRASDTAGTDNTALLQSAALALLSGEGPGVTDRLTQAIGLDSVGVRQQSVGDVKETIVSLGKQLSKRWYVGYERGLNATSGSWQLIYRVAQRVTVRAQAGDDNSVDLIWTLRWK